MESKILSCVLKAAAAFVYTTKSRGPDRPRDRNFAPNLRMRKWTLADEERLDILHQIIAIVIVHFQSDGFRKIQTKDAQNGLSIDHVPAHSQINIIRITIRNVNKRFNILREAKLNIHCSHKSNPNLSQIASSSHIIKNEYYDCKAKTRINEYLIALHRLIGMHAGILEPGIFAMPD